MGADRSERGRRFPARRIMISTRKKRGQSTVEFALISFFLFAILLAIIETGRFLFVYSVVSNAPQEGSRYGIVRPRDLYSTDEAQRRIALGTPVATFVVVPNGSCNVVDKTREKIWGIPRADVRVNVTFDNGNGTPTVVPQTFSDINYVTAPGGTNRIAVEATYNYQFLVPFFSALVPGGIDIKMRSARTILRFGDEPAPCVINTTPAPTRTATNTPTYTPTNTPTNTPTFTPTNTVTRTPTNTRTSTPMPPTATVPATATATATPDARALTISGAQVLSRSSNGAPLYIQLNVTAGGSPFPFATVVADIYLNGVLNMSNVPVAHAGNGTYRTCTGAWPNGSTLDVDIRATASGYTSAERRGVRAVNGSFTCP